MSEPESRYIRGVCIVPDNIRLRHDSDVQAAASRFLPARRKECRFRVSDNVLLQKRRVCRCSMGYTSFVFSFVLRQRLPMSTAAIREEES